ncbi:hypothetical protein AB4037_14030 [Labrys sp. KB_33_2]|uniref:hypothetical protein n=1 Tax=Labrys sp. KB_33_2 TaxID=3237479 RepID=UPI003F90CACF
MFAITTAETQNSALDGWHGAQTDRDHRVSALRAHLSAAAADWPLIEAAWALENALVILRRGGLHLSAELSGELADAVHQAFAKAADRLPLDFDDVSEGFAAILEAVAANTKTGSVLRPLPNFPRRELHHRTGLFRAQLETVARRAELELLAKGKGSSGDDTGTGKSGSPFSGSSVLAFPSQPRSSREKSQ